MTDTAVMDEDLRAFFAGHPDFDLLDFDFYDTAAVDGLRLDPKRAGAVLDKLRAWQRVRRVAPDDASATALLAAGLDSANQISRLPEYAFVRQFTAAFGGDARAAQLTHQRAVAVKAYLTHAYAELHSTLGSAHFTTLHSHHASPDLRSYFDQLPDFQRMFGPVSQIAASDRPTIFSPAAYLVDLLRIADDYVTGANRDIPRARTLVERRPDLFELPLTTETVGQPRPALEIVNAVLARRVADSRPISSGTAQGASADAIALDRTADKRDDAYAGMTITITGGTGAGQRRVITRSTARKATVDAPWSPRPDTTSTYVVTRDPDTVLATAGYPMNLPWNPALAETRRYLGALRTGLEQIHQAFAAPGGAGGLAADLERLGLSVEQFQVITTRLPAGPELAARFGQSTLDVAKLAAVDTFLARTGLDRPGLSALLTQGLSAAEQQAGAGAAFFVNATGEKLAPMRIVTERGSYSYIGDLSAQRLDRLHRFVRLAAALGWEYATLQAVLTSLGAADLDAATIQALAQVARARAVTGLGLVELCALWSDLSTTGKGDGPVPADRFNQVFNAAGRSSVTFDPRAPLDWNPDPFTASGADGVIRARLLAALRIGDDDLTRLANHLRADDTPRLRLDLATLSWLHRLATTARLVKLPIEGYLHLLNLTHPPAPRTVPTVDHVLAQVDRGAWLAASGLSPATVGYLLGGPPSPAVPLPYREADLPAFLAGLAASGRPTRLGPDAFQPGGLDPTKSQAVFQALVAASVLTSDGVVDAPPDRARLSVPSGIADRVVGILETARAQQHEHALRGLADLLHTGRDRLAALLPFATASGDLLGLLDALLAAPADQPPPAGVSTVVGWLAQALVLCDAAGLSVAQISAVTGAPRAFGLTAGAPVALTVDAVRAVWEFARLGPAFADAEALAAYLRHVHGPATTGSDAAALAALTGWPAEQVSQLVDRFWPDPAEPGHATVAGLGRLRDCFAIAAATGLDIGSLLRLHQLAGLPVADARGELDAANWQTYQQAAQLARHAASVRCGDGFGQVETAVRAALDEQRRDALVGYTVATVDLPGVTGPDTLSEYLLLDVRTSGADAVSPVASAIASVQLYLQRCRLTLEPGVRDLSAIPAVWWDWLSAYRRWEANRRIFLYPENYLQPSLRRGATPEFGALAQALLGGDVSAASVTAAYQRYFADFATVAQLVPCGAYLGWPAHPGPDVVVAEGTVSAPGGPVVVYLGGHEHSPKYDGLTITVKVAGRPDQSRTIVQGFPIVATVDRPFTDIPPPGTPWSITAPATPDTLFLIGRTHTEPHAYYHRRHHRQRGWTPWQKIPLTVPATQVSPVFAFGRLFLTWIEQRQVDSPLLVGDGDGGQNSITTTAVNAAIRFASLDTDGTWSAPQTADDLVINFQREHALDAYVGRTLPALSPQFDPALSIWTKPYAVFLPAYRAGHDRLVFILGPAQPTAGTALPAPAAPAPGPPAQAAFTGAAQHLAQRYADLKAALPSRTGYLPVARATVVDVGLTRAQQDVTLISMARPVAQPYGPVLARETGVLGIGRSGTLHTLVDDYLADDHPQARRFDPGLVQVPLLTGVTGARAAVTTVKNMPGSFLLDVGDEAFLVRSSDGGVLPVSDTVRVWDPQPTLPAGLYLENLPPFTRTEPPPPLEQLGFAFTRLSTQAGPALSARLARAGLADLLSLAAQRTPELPFARLAPTAQATAPATDQLDFDGAHGQYFWEIFFHAPLLVADALHANQRFAEAKSWLEYVYNPTQQPTDGDGDAKRYWRFLPLRAMDLPTIIQTLTNPAQVAAYNDNPFDPDAIARLRVSAYAKSVVMRYLTNLLDWGDFLFAQDTRESITEATNLYLLTLDLLGRRPEPPPPDTSRPRPRSYADIKRAYTNQTLATGTVRAAGPSTVTLDGSASTADDEYTGMYVTITGGPGLGQAARCITGYTGATAVATVDPPWDAKPAPASTYRVFASGVPQYLIRLENSALATAAPAGEDTHADVPFHDIGAYFGVPENDQLVAYWDRVEDRLFKIRNSLDLHGRRRTLAQFAPPLDPAALVRAAAAGAGAAGADTPAPGPLPQYRFETLLARAKEATAMVAQLGTHLLATLERKDGEALAALRVAHERALLDLATTIKQQAVEQVKQNAKALEASHSAALGRVAYYDRLIGAGLSPGEKANIAGMVEAAIFNMAAADVRTAAAIGYAVPQAGSPFAMTYGGQQVGAALTAASGVLDIFAIAANFQAQVSLTLAQYNRRDEEWRLQRDLARNDLEQIVAHEAATAAQSDAAKQDLAIHAAAIAQTDAVATFLTGRFTNEELYQWLAARLSALHFQTYTLALDLARAAERAYQYQLDVDTSFVTFGYWDGGRRGLLAGEGLMLALNQMEKSYLERNERRLDIEKTVSLLQLDPKALLTLIRTGECTFALPEKLFDEDFPGHYTRKIHSLAVSIPAVTGPYQNIHATLTQLTNQVVVAPDPDAVAYLLSDATTTNPTPATTTAAALRTNWWVRQQVVLSAGMADSGVFDDTRMDGRYLPFEGTGAVSTWLLSLPRTTNHFDFQAISDVILHLRYTARDGGDEFRRKVLDLPAMSRYTGTVFLSMARVFSTQWYEFLHAPPPDGRQSLRFTLADLVPPQVTEATLTRWYLKLAVPAGTAVAGTGDYLTLNLGTAQPFSFRLDADASQTHDLTVPMDTVAGAGSLEFNLASAPGALRSAATRSLDPAILADAVLILSYEGKRG